MKASIVHKDSKVTDKQERFCREYLKDLNGMQAAIRAGYSKKTAGASAVRMMALPHVQKRIQELFNQRAKREEIDADVVLRGLLEIAMADPADAFDENGQLKPIREMSPAIRKTISGFDIYEDFNQRVKIGETKKIKFWDKIKAFELLGKHLRLFADKLEVDITDDLADRIAKARARVQEIDVTPKKISEGEE